MPREEGTSSLTARGVAPNGRLPPWFTIRSLTRRRCEAVAVGLRFGRFAGSELNAYFSRSREFEVICWLYCVVDRLAMAGQVAPVIFVHEVQSKFDVADEYVISRLDGCEGAPP